MEDNILDADFSKKENTGKKFTSIGEVSEFKKTIRQVTQSSLDEGKSKADIYKDFIREYGNRYEKLIAQIISFSLPSEKIKNNKQLINIAIILQSISILLLLPIYYFRFTTTEYSTVGFIFSGVWVLVEISLLRGLLKNNGQVYSSIILIFMIKMFSSFGELGGYNYNILLILSLIISIALIFTCILINKKLFGKIYYRGVKKSKLGTRIFEEN